MARGNKIGTRDNLASAYVSSGYSVLRWKTCGNITHLVGAPYPLHPQNVDMCIHISVSISTRDRPRLRAKRTDLDAHSVEKPGQDCLIFPQGGLDSPSPVVAIPT